MKHNALLKKIALLVAMFTLFCAVLTGCGEEAGTDSGSEAETESKAGTNGTIIVQTNAFFAPFEYYDGDAIVGVDVDIMNLVGKAMNKDVEFKNTDFSAVIGSVAEGKLSDCGAACITITEERKELVNFSIPYFTSMQYVIYLKDAAPETVNGEYVVWEALAGKQIGVQTDTTGWIYLDGEINATEDDPDYGYNGVLVGTGTELVNFDDAMLAAEAVKAGHCDYVIVDKLPAEYIVNGYSGFACLPLYYTGGEGEEDFPVEEQYAIAVNKQQNELLEAINKVLAELIENGEVDKLIMKHMGLEK